MPLTNLFFLKTPKKDSSFSEETKSKLALEYSSIGVWEFDAEAQRVYFSEGSKQIIDINDRDFGKNPQDWNNRVHPDDKQKYFQDFQDHLNGIKPMYDSVHRIRCADGSYKWIRDRGKIVEWTKDGRYKRINGTHTDITALKNAEATTKNALDIATEHNNRLKNFAHIVTHNLKQHSANLESLLEFYGQEQCELEKEAIFTHLLSLSSSFTKTIRNLNDIVSVQSGKNKKVEKIYLAAEVDNILKVLETVVTKSKATVNNNINKKLFIYYNPSYFESIVQNLLTNAIKYKHPERNPIIDIDCTYNHEKIELRVTDNGLGIDLKKFGKHVFGLYKTFHRNVDAEGVGLYLVKNQIENFGGSIAVESEKEKGTSFIITAPNKKPDELLASPV